MPSTGAGNGLTTEDRFRRLFEAEKKMEDG